MPFPRTADAMDRGPRRMRLSDLPDSVNEVSGQVLDAAIKVHIALGPGLLESTYKRCLAYELKQRGLSVQREVPVDLEYGDLRIENAYFVDLLVADGVIVEAKTVEKLLPIHEAQMLTYQRLLKKSLGILLNFHAQRISSEEGFRRRALGPFP